MSELQTGLLAIGALVIAGVLAYNRIQERRAKREAERAFSSGHDDILLRPSGATHGASRLAEHAAVAQPDPAIDYIIEIAAGQSVAESALREQWHVIERRHARRAMLAGSADGRSWRAALQLVSRDGAVGEADLIEFRSSVETMAASVGATVSAPEMRTAVDAARALDEFCAQSDIQVVVHVTGGPFAGTKIRAAVEASGLALEPEGIFAMRDDERRLLYTLAAQDGRPFAAATMRDAAPTALSLSLDVTRAPDTRRSFESLARLAHQLATALGANIVDDNAKALDERAMAAIAVQLDSVRARLEAKGLPPGSPAALRLFS